MALDVTWVVWLERMGQEGVAGDLNTNTEIKSVHVSEHSLFLSVQILKAQRFRDTVNICCAESKIELL